MTAEPGNRKVRLSISSSNLKILAAIRRAATNSVAAVQVAITHLDIGFLINLDPGG